MKFLKYVLGAALLCMVAGLAIYPTATNNSGPINEWVGSTPLANQLQETAEVSDLSNVHQVAARNNSRKAAVKVITPDGRGSGTYFKVGGYYIVVTAQHVVGDSPFVLIEGRNGETVYGQPILQGVETDVAIILVPEINSRRALRYKTLQQPRDIDRIVGRNVTYTGFPASHDLMTVDGQIAGYENGHIIIHSYAWPGSSGSGVFDMRGRLVGVVSAVDIGRWNWMVPPQLVEDVVWIAPIWSITEADITAYLRSRGE